MVRVRPFRALQPEPKRAARVASVPYDVVTTAEARDLHVLVCVDNEGQDLGGSALVYEDLSECHCAAPLLLVMQSRHRPT